MLLSTIINSGLFRNFSSLFLLVLIWNWKRLTPPTPRPIPIIMEGIRRCSGLTDSIARTHPISTQPKWAIPVPVLCKKTTPWAQSLKLCHFKIPYSQSQGANASPIPQTIKSIVDMQNVFFLPILERLS